MIRTIVGFSAWLVAAAMLGCGPGLPAEAKQHCDELRQGNVACLPDTAHQACVDCYQECGKPCAQLESCPLQFACPK